MQVQLALKLIESAISETRGNADHFAENLRRREIPHISYSQVAAVEACPHRYYLQYVLNLEPNPVPDYFTKGKLLHRVIATSYETLAQHQNPDASEHYRQVAAACQGDAQRHLCNAVTVHLEHLWQEYEVVAVEQPFALIIEDGLPPCVGVIDLILRQDGHYLLVDHKTGRDFYPQDVLQMSIYQEYIRNRFGDQPCSFFYDNYRWVNNLGRIRKPPFQRTEVTHLEPFRSAALERIRDGWRAIEQIRNADGGIKSGECFRCPYRRMCR